MHQSFFQAHGAALQACPNEALAKLMYPLHLLMGSPSLPSPLMATLPLTARSKNPFPSPINPADLQLQFLLPGPNDTDLQNGKLQQISWGVSLTKVEGERSSGGTLGGSHHEAFHKDSELVQCIRQTYFKTHAKTFHKEDTNKLMEVFKELAEMEGLLGTEVYPIHDQWVGKKELCSVYHAVRVSAKDLHFFRTVAPLESSKIMGL